MNRLLNKRKEKNSIAHLIRHRKWNKALTRIRTRRGRKEVSEILGIQGSSGGSSGAGDSDNDSDTSLLTLCLLQKPPVELVNAILEIDPCLSIKADKNGMTPLHIACGCGSYSEVIQCLLQYTKGVGATMKDKWHRTPLHHLLEYICYPEYKGRLQESYGVEPSTSEELSQQLESQQSQQPAVRKDSMTTSMTQDELQDLTNALYDIIYWAPEVIYALDVDGNYPIDLVHDCRAAQTGGLTPKHERATIACTILREESIRIYRCAKAKVELNRQRLFPCKIGSQEDDSIPTMEGSSVTSASVSTGMSKMEVCSVSIDRMNLSACSGMNE
mmetsp:Transcript_20704/g.30569  ORF Transcript_20704/g.30569 Transcript_20704/m.30569 type:complete len:329 (-) Transcript_20704:121-1107(-)